MLSHAQSQDPERVRKTYAAEDPRWPLPCAVGGVPTRGMAPMHLSSSRSFGLLREPLLMLSCIHLVVSVIQVPRKYFSL